MFPCKNWERMNLKLNICFTHGVSDFEQCFLKVISVSGFTQNPSTKLSQIHKLHWDTPFACIACDELNVDLMSQVVMYFVAHIPYWLEMHLLCFFYLFCFAFCFCFCFVFLILRQKLINKNKKAPEGLLFLDTNILDHLMV